MIRNIHRSSVRNVRWFFRRPTEKDIYSGYNSILHFGCASMTGYREEMQDRHILKLNVLEDIDNPEYEKYAVNTANEFVACFSVFDGHGGSLCSTKVKRTLVKNLMEEQYKKRLEIIKHELANGASVGDRALYTALQTKFSWLENDNDFVNAFLKTDHDILLEQVQSGATGTVCIILPDQDFRKKGLLSGSNMVPIQHGARKLELITANIGDSRAVLYHNGETKLITQPHNPEDPAELERIVKAGGFVERNRLDGLLSLSRAFGDVWAKKDKRFSDREQKCIAVPDVQRYKFEIKEYFKPDDFSFLIVGCDGLWSGFGIEEAVQLVKNQLIEQWNKDGKNSKNSLFRFNLSSICDMLADHSVQSKDNVTVTVVLFRQEM